MHVWGQEQGEQLFERVLNVQFHAPGIPIVLVPAKGFLGRSGGGVIAKLVIKLYGSASD